MTYGLEVCIPLLTVCETAFILAHTLLQLNTNLQIIIFGIHTLISSTVLSLQVPISLYYCHIDGILELNTGGKIKEKC